MRNIIFTITEKIFSELHIDSAMLLTCIKMFNVVRVSRLVRVELDARRDVGRGPIEVHVATWRNGSQKRTV